jgi:hypothetical protein
MGGECSTHGDDTLVTILSGMPEGKTGNLLLRMDGRIILKMIFRNKV